MTSSMSVQHYGMKHLEHTLDTALAQDSQKRVSSVHTGLVQIPAGVVCNARRSDD